MGTTDAGPPAIRADGLCKRYGGRTAVTGLGFNVQPGQVCALLGPNGAGKTSTMRMLTGLSRPDRGTAELLGRRVALGAPVLHRAGVLIDGPAFVPHLSGRRNLRLMWTATGRHWPPPALAESLALAGLGDAIDRRVRGYSMGMKQRLMLAQALMGAPEVLVLDEPANGLDPAEVRALRRHLIGLTRSGVAVLISSHQLAEVQQLASHVVVMARGALVAAGPLAELLGDDGSYRYEVDDAETAARVLRSVPRVRRVTVRDSAVIVTAPGVPARELTRALVAADVGVNAVDNAGRTLEDAFLALVGGEESDAAR